MERPNFRDLNNMVHKSVNSFKQTKKSEQRNNSQLQIKKLNNDLFKVLKNSELDQMTKKAKVPSMPINISQIQGSNYKQLNMNTRSAYGVSQNSQVSVANSIGMPGHRLIEKEISQEKKIAKTKDHSMQLIKRLGMKPHPLGGFFKQSEEQSSPSKSQERVCTQMFILN